ncbi:MAG: hypothetical protein SO360_01820 [Bifidobacterium tsurumiense]|uniref:hypothetical protein n=1 Tax=Bifidobacterium tsurumiense TaxID=356829 RepID=UPI002A7F683A|nr:hypothetical protein [Bifidobacterium tsurumiense]MDY4677590.1 hypothetical protein [Bifidobacterium tsurumiense]
MNIDASQLHKLAERLTSAPARKQAKIVAAVNHGALNVKNAIKSDLSTSKDKGFRHIPIRYEAKVKGTSVEADIAPTKGGAGNLANLAFFGTSRGGGTHRFYEHAEEEFDTVADFVRKAAIGL